jgi:hypothetical protein
MCQYFLDNVTIYNASDDAYIVFLAFFAFVDVNIEYSSKALSPRHAPSMVRLSLVGGMSAASLPMKSRGSKKTWVHAGYRSHHDMASLIHSALCHGLSCSNAAR